MNAEILSIGNEILIGQTINTNASFVGHELTEIGINVRWITVVGDKQEDILAAISIADNRADVIVATGGLGPTHDDITKTVFCKYFGSNLILDKTILREVKNRFKKRGVEMPGVNVGQAMVPDNAYILKNHFGTAPGLRFMKNGKHFFVIPGVPFEMKNLIESQIIPFLAKKTNNCIRYRTIRTTDIGESALFEKIGIIDKLQELTEIAFLPNYSGVDIRIKADARTEQDCFKKIQYTENLITEKISKYIWGYDDQRIENLVVNGLLKKGKKLAIFELFTGGLIVEKLSNTSGFSKIITEAVVTADVNLLNQKLGISEKIMHVHSEFSPEWIKEVANRARRTFNADYSIATSAIEIIIDVESKEQNGCLHVGFASDSTITYRKLRLSKDYIFNKNRAAHLAMDFLRRQSSFCK